MRYRDNKLIAMFLVTVCLFAYTTWVVQGRDYTALSNADFIRFHVIANSNNGADQNLKQLVRNELLSVITEEMALEAMAQPSDSDEHPALDIEVSRQYLLDNLSRIEEIAEDVVRKEGYDYSVSAALGARFVPQKTYGNITLPAGNYEALNVVIGDGEGENWWCVLFPPLCLIGAEAPEEMDADLLFSYSNGQAEAVYREALSGGKYDDLLKASKEQEPTTLKLKFKVLEMINID